MIKQVHAGTQSGLFLTIKFAQKSLFRLLSRGGPSRKILLLSICIPHTTVLLLIKGNLTNGISKKIIKRASKNAASEILETYRNDLTLIIYI